MTAVRPLLCAYPVYPWAEIGVGDSRIPTGQASWDVSRWDNPAALWAGPDPTWLDVSCEVITAASSNGRERMIERFRPGTADVTLRNLDGWADLAPPPHPPATLTLRPGRPIRYGVDTPAGRHVVFRGIIDEAVPVYDPYGTDVVNVNAIDVLGEVARLELAPLTTAVGDGETVDVRVARILDAAKWHATARSIDPASMRLQGTVFGAQVADLLGIAADSAGGAVFGDLQGRVCYRRRDWQTYPPTTPPDAVVGNIDPDAVCPSTWELSWRRRDVAAVVTMGRADGVAVTVADQSAQIAIGPEPFVRSDLITFDPADLDVLARRVLVTRAMSTMPRIESVTLDAARDPGDGRVVELMATARPETPTRIRCQLQMPSGRDVFDVDMFVTGVEHTIGDTGRWLCRLTLDVAAPFAAPGGLWDVARWDRATWAGSPSLTTIGAS